MKKEPSSPDLPTPRHRPRKLDLSKNVSGSNPMTGRNAPLTSRESGLGIQDVGLACLSPGFVTQDPTMREQLQRSISVREQQRHIIESRLLQTAKPGDAPMESAKEREMAGPGGVKTPATTRRKVPPGLSIVAPSHEQFANERVIQSAPLNQSFTGLRGHNAHPLTRHITNQPSNLSNTSHIHHVPATQTANRLPPITDVFAGEGLGQHREAPRTGFFPPPNGSSSSSSHSNSRPSIPSPGHAPAQPLPSARDRPREYRSAEEAQVELAGGRPELLPKIVHYGGHQPPTPPSPLTGNAMKRGDSHGRSGRRRARDEYEEGASPPLGNGPATSRRGQLRERDSPDEQRRKKERFMALCLEAWELLHS